MKKFVSVEDFSNWIRNKKEHTDEDRDFVVLSVLMEMKRRDRPVTELHAWLHDIGLYTNLLDESQGSYTKQFQLLLDSAERLSTRPGLLVATHSKYKEMFKDATIKQFLKDNSTVN